MVLVPRIDAQAKSRIFIENKPGFYLRMYIDAQDGTDAAD